MCRAIAAGILFVLLATNGNNHNSGYLNCDYLNYISIGSNTNTFVAVMQAVYTYIHAWVLWKRHSVVCHAYVETSSSSCLLNLLHRIFRHSQ